MNEQVPGNSLSHRLLSDHWLAAVLSCSAGKSPDFSFCRFPLFCLFVRGCFGSFSIRASAPSRTECVRSVSFVHSEVMNQALFIPKSFSKAALHFVIQTVQHISFCLTMALMCLCIWRSFKKFIESEIKGQVYFGANNLKSWMRVLQKVHRSGYFEKAAQEFKKLYNYKLQTSLLFFFNFRERKVAGSPSHWFFS